MAYEYNQAPKEFAAQAAAFKKKHTDVDNLTGHIGQPKYDGVFCFIHTDTMEARSRTGEAFLSVPHLIAECARCFGPGWVVFMELYQFNTLHKDINGAARRQRPQNQLIGMVFDAVPVFRFKQKLDPTPYHQRLTDLSSRIENSTLLHQVMQFSIAECKWTEVALVYKNDTFNAYDGLIIRDPNGEWAPGAAKHGEVIKVKPSLSLDLVVVGHQVEQRATKLGGYFTVEYNGVRSDVGSGLTQAMLQGLTLGAHHVGKVVEVECMGITPDGKLREPRFKGFRFDTVAEEHKGD